MSETTKKWRDGFRRNCTTGFCTEDLAAYAALLITVEQALRLLDDADRLAELERQLTETRSRFAGYQDMAMAEHDELVRLRRMNDEKGRTTSADSGRQGACAVATRDRGSGADSAEKESTDGQHEQPVSGIRPTVKAISAEAHDADRLAELERENTRLGLIVIDLQAQLGIKTIANAAEGMRAVIEGEAGRMIKRIAELEAELNEERLSGENLDKEHRELQHRYRATLSLQTQAMAKCDALEAEVERLKEARRCAGCNGILIPETMCMDCRDGIE